MDQFTPYDTIMERLSLGQLWDFPGGVHPTTHKSLSNTVNIAKLPLPKFVHIPVKQHIGVDGELLVKLGEHVLKGQALTKSENPFAVPVHASSSGVITAIGQHPSAHPSGLNDLTITIELDGKDDWIATKGFSDFTKASKNQLITAICAAGVSGLGGAGFPTHIKSNNAKPLEFIIINGIECEPYISSDDRIMREHAWQIRQGIDILAHLLQPKQVIIAVEDNKPEAIETMSIACQQKADYQVISVPTKYPAGGEKQLIQVLTSREVPADGLPIDVGCMMFNVGTCFAVSDAVIEGKPLIERVVTVTGKAIQNAQNVWALLGTPISHLLQHCHYASQLQSHPQIIMGGPMMGFTIASAKTPVVKITNCILAPAREELASTKDERACIRCSACADACPASLLPQQLYWYSKAKDFETAEDYNLFDCIECGACAYVCPSEIPLVHYYRQAKSNIRQQQQEKEQADKARVRFEARKERLEREKQEREDKHRKAAEARKQAMSKDGGAAKDKIAAALARAKAKKAALASDKDKTVNIAKQSSINNDNQESEKSDVKDKQSDKGTTNENLEQQTEKTAAELKKQKVAAAIAKAKAKKLQNDKQQNDETNND
ncbi:electron transport complex subunit RsxC [Glaciecola petra]|uniref:Ion-translocating oxidoreductase complex subunit C n=1 Tax=Glaciecola petra TaxID=3075602 RepID=A0ABU2ZNJ6_9ALTE|nr:electron transport complex subunit RsxC [Aestuariibacter sp. P117]MDT0593919.1 electron transport complex subunit RsxC [Aestuariibacter sp. P117]